MGVDLHSVLVHKHKHLLTCTPSSRSVPPPVTTSSCGPARWGDCDACGFGAPAGSSPRSFLPAVLALPPSNHRRWKCHRLQRPSLRKRALLFTLTCRHGVLIPGVPAPADRRTTTLETAVQRQTVLQFDCSPRHLHRPIHRTPALRSTGCALEVDPAAAEQCNHRGSGTGGHRGGGR